VKELSAADPHVVQPNHAPTPFLAEEIHAACPVGRTIRQLVEVEGEDPIVRVQRYVWSTERYSTTERWQESLDGARLGPSEFRDATWLELQAHASFPQWQTEISQDAIETPLGLVDCLRYSVTDEDGIVNTMWFARHLPGMPIKSVTEENGKIVESVTMISNTFA
jgi:hypothetical protein